LLEKSTNKQTRDCTKNSVDSSKKNLMTVFILVSNLGFVMVFFVIGSFFLGLWLDKIFQKDYIFLIIFIILGIVSGFFQCYRLLKKEFKL